MRGPTWAKQARNGLLLTGCLLAGAFTWSSAAVAQNATGASAKNGATVFGQVCFACHGEQGQGVTGIAPALAGPLAPALAQPDGENYLIQVLLRGLSGRIVSQGQVFTGAMPSQTALGDESLAAVANHVAQTLNGKSGVVFKPEDFAQARAQQTAPSHKALRDLRTRLMP